MSNQNAPFGLKPSSKLGSNYNNEGVTEYKIASGATGSIFSGDLVKMLNTGTVLVAGATDNPVLGVFRGCQYTDASGDVIYSSYWPNGTVTSDAVAFVVDDPNALFEVQSAATGSVVQTVVGNNADSVYTTGSTQTGMSGVEIRGTTAATSATPGHAHGLPTLLHGHSSAPALSPPSPLCSATAPYSHARRCAAVRTTCSSCPGGGK